MKSFHREAHSFSGHPALGSIFGEYMLYGCLLYYPYTRFVRNMIGISVVTKNGG